MSADDRKSRADAARCKYDPPKAGMFASASERQGMQQRVQEYRKRYYDERLEMGLKN